ncbi:MAG: RHS repeat-associated core domain-containing protein, partial [Halobacteriovoraceae bacterium]|nr:RHS repeat-associated core domain-containing protein [Halobacteriovoraceae bacterium]
KIDRKGRSVSYTHDGNRNITSMSDEADRVFSFSYDELNRVIGKTVPGDSLLYSYDINGNITSLEDNDSKVEFTYSNLDNVLTTTSSGLGGLSDFPNITINYQYDQFGNKTGMSDPYGATGYTYNSQNFLVGLTNHNQETFQFDRTSEGRLERIIRPGSVTENTYDKTDFITSINHSTNTGQVTYFDFLGRDSVGNRTQIQTEDGIQNFAYDKDNQLTSFENLTLPAPFAQENFSYDLFGNRTSHGFVHDPNDFTLTETSTHTFEYDVFGNLIKKSVKNSATQEYSSFFYNFENKLIGVDFYENGSVSKSVRYFYDPLGRRIGKTIEDNLNPSNSLERRYVYDSNELSLVFDDENNLLSKYTHSGLRTDDVLAIDVKEQGFQEGISRSPGSYFYHKDGLGSVSAISDSTGEILQKNSYSAFGELASINDKDGNDISSNPHITPYFAYTAREYDQETGLMYYRARCYDPSLGRFLTEDPIEFAAGDSNFYRYVRNNPLTSTDPYGKFGITVTVGGGLRWLGIGGEVNPIGIAVTYSKKDGLQGAFINSVAGKFGLGLGASADISVGLTNARNLNDLEGAFIGASIEATPFLGIGGFANVSRASDGKNIYTLGVSPGVGISVGASLDVGYQNVIGDTKKNECLGYTRNLRNSPKPKYCRNDLD